MKFDHIIIDTSSLINFIRYYYFDKNNSNQINSKLYNFILEKIKLGEIIIIDKVFDEIRSKDLLKFKEEIKKYIKNSLYLIGEVGEIIEKYYIESNEVYLNNDQQKILFEKEKFEQEYADLYLIEVCKEIKENGKKPILITEESFKRDGKLLPKLPIICKKENIECKMIPHALFEVYKEELKFSLEI